MKLIKEKLDPKYTKIALYAGITVILVVVALYVLYCSRGVWSVTWNLIVKVLKPIIIGGVLCYLIEPLVNFFDEKLKAIRKKDWKSRGLATLISLILVFSVIAAILVVILWTMTKQLLTIDYNAIINLFENTQNDAVGLADQVKNYLSKAGFNVSSIGTKVPDIVSAVTGSISTVFFGIIFAIYFLVDGKRISRYWKNAGNVILPKKTIKLIKELSSDADLCFSGYIRGQAIDAIIVGTVASIVLILVKMPYAFLIGLIIGIGNLIPYVGPILGYIAVIIVNVTSYNPRMLIIGLIVIAVIMFVDSNIINPKLLSGTIKVHPLLVVASLLAGGAVGGIIGMIISVPAGAFLKMQFEKWIELEKKKK